jgi:hypothetical protein
VDQERGLCTLLAIVAVRPLPAVGIARRHTRLIDIERLARKFPTQEIEFKVGDHRFQEQMLPLDDFELGCAYGAVVYACGALVYARCLARLIG